MTPRLPPGIGAAIPRREDRRFLTGQGRYGDDAALPGQVHACFVRAPHAHARIAALDVAAAAALPGVHAILTAADYRADGLGGILHNAVPADTADERRPAFAGADGAPVPPFPHWPIVGDTVRHVGEIVAVAVAETPMLARDAAERVAVAYEPLPAVTDAAAAVLPGAPLLWERFPGNVYLEGAFGDAAATEAAFAAADHVVALDVWSNRVAAAPMEPRAAIGAFDAEAGRYTLRAGSQGVVRYRAALATLFGVAPDAVRVVSEDVGGAFGIRTSLYPEYVLVMWAARRVGRPVKWTADRSEGFVSDFQGRDLHTRAALALDRDGRFLALRIDQLGNIGAHAASVAPLANGSRIATSLYAVPAARLAVKAVFTNTLPVSPYRGAGRPEAVFVFERLIDIAARETGIDRIELRRRNLIARMPHGTPLGLVYDGGAFAENMAAAMAAADWDGFPARRAAARARGRLRGIGLANYVETPVGWPQERAEVAVDPAGRIRVVLGTQASGQGHETSFAQVVAAWLGVDPDRVDLVTGDTDVVRAGGGTHSDRSMRMAGTVLVDAAERIVAQGRRLAAHLLEAAERDIAFVGGRFGVAGTDRALDLFALAAAADAADLPAELHRPLAAEAEIGRRIPAYPNGCAVCEVEIDPETGAVAVVRYTAVDDVGRVVSPLIVDGQIHGGIAQGLGQALFEDCVYQPETGQLLSGSFMDYCMPRADDLPSFHVTFNEVPAANNPLGVKGAGEGGTTPAAAAAINAVVDALSEYGVRHVETPATPERIWRLIRDNAAGPRPLTTVQTIETPVLVVGAGPVGLALAGDLGWRGTSCTVVEQSDGTIVQPRQDLVGIRTMEFCRRWGIVGDVEASPYPRDYPQDNVYIAGSLARGWEIGRYEVPSMNASSPPPESPQRRERCPQNMFDPILRKFASSFDGVRLLYRHRFVSFAQTEGGVVAEVDDLAGDRRLRIRAAYLVACDGAGSTVRTQAGIPMLGKPVLTYTTNVIFRCPGFEALHDKRPGYRFILIGTEGTWATIVAINGRDQWRMSIVRSSETRRALGEDEVHAAIRRAVGVPFDYEILTVVPWTRRELVAERFADGRVLIAGDAAHVMSPTGGFGMNTGVGDAVDLSWKLTALLQGWGGARLIGSYTAERRPVAVRNVTEASGNLARMLSPGENPRLLDDTAEGAALRAALGEAFARQMQREWKTLGIHLGYVYEDSPICAPDGTPPPPDDPGVYVQTARPGSRAPHVWLRDGRSTLDLFGRSFVLLRLGPDAPAAEALAAAARERGMPLATVAVDEPAVARAYARRLVLVRPDGHVAWRGDAVPDSPAALVDRVRGAL